ncbi:LpqN/LpqT family lipoprotein [Mycolicibacterium thermoresistibile]
MNRIARRKWTLVGGVAAGLAGILGFAGSTAAAQPMVPQPPPPPAPATVTQTVTVAAGPVEPVGPLSRTPGLGVDPATGVAIGTVPAASATPAAPVAVARETLVPATSGTLREFFAERGVRLEPQSASGFTALNIVLPMPKGWSHVPDPNVPDAFAVIADRVSGGLYTSNAQVVVYRLIGDFDPTEAIRHGYVDSLQLPAWRTTDQSLAAHHGWPSALIEGTYRDSSITLNTSRRHVIATSGADRYLVTLSVTTSVDQAVAAADATDAIVNGFKVTSPTPATPEPAAAPAPAPVPAPAPAPVSLPGLAAALPGAQP